MTLERWTTHIAAVEREILVSGEALANLIPDPKVMFHSPDDVAAMTEEQAHEVIRMARRVLLFQLLSQETHEHWLDDCGDDLIGATATWATLYEAYFRNDGNCLEEVKAFLLEDRVEWYAADVRHYVWADTDYD